MRGTDHWRVVGIVPAELRDREKVTFDDIVPSVRGEAGSSLAFQSCSWFLDVPHPSPARAASFQDRRCFVLGDAAHVHSPVGAQGMNTGLQDAYNLAWKLALVVAGKADASLVESYAAERKPIAEWLLHNTDRGFRLVVSDGALAGLLRTEVLARVASIAMSFKRVQARAFRTVSQTGIHYRGGPLSATSDALPSTAPQTGDRFPWLKLALGTDASVLDLYETLDDLHFHLFVFGQTARIDVAPSVRALLTVHAVRDQPANVAELARARIPQPSFYLVRPDGYIGLCGTRLDDDAVARYFSERLHMR